MKKYHHVRVGSQYSGGRVRTVPFGTSIKARISYPKESRKGKKRAERGKGKGRVISLLFSPNKFTLSQAKSWAKKHGYSVKKTAKADVMRKAKKSLKKRRKNPVRVKVVHKGILEVPRGKKVIQMKVGHFKKLAKRKGHAAISRALTNLERWNKNRNKKLSRWATAMKAKLRKALGKKATKKKKKSRKLKVHRGGKRKRRKVAARRSKRKTRRKSRSKRR